MLDLTDRQKIILDLVIRDYIERANPVSSGHLAEYSRLNVSDATIRNELSILTDKGYLRQPHTSAGRVPTEEGYRFFVSRIVDQTELDAETRNLITAEFYQDGREIRQWYWVAARLLARRLRAASVVTAPVSQRKLFKHLELINTHGRWIMMILVKEGGEVSEQMLTLAEPYTQEQLSAAAKHITHLFRGMDADQIDSYPAHYNPLEGDIVNLILEDLRSVNTIQIGEIFRAGLPDMMAEPEFGDKDVARNALRILEERPLLEELLVQEVLTGRSEQVRVVIGDEGKWEALKDCSVVLARYGEPNVVIGTLGVLGPMRMPYRRTINTVRLVADLLSGMIFDARSENTGRISG